MGVPMDVGLGGNLGQGIAYENHSSAGKFEAVVREAITDLVQSRTLIFLLEQAESTRELQVSAVGVVEEKAKRRIVRDVTFGGDKEKRFSASVNNTAKRGKISERLIFPKR